MFSVPARFRRFVLLPILLAVAAPMLWAQPAHRQAPLTVRVQTTDGEALSGATVRVEMLNHAFRFGSAVAAGKIEPGNAAFDTRTVSALQEYFNSVTYENELKWTQFEGRTAARTRELVQNAYDLRAFNSPDAMRQRGHATIWGAQPFVPADVRAMTDPAVLRARLLKHVEDYHTVLKGLGIDNYDLYNEPFSERAFIIQKLIPTGASRAVEAAEIASWFKRAKEIDPEAKLFINEYNMLNFWQEDDARIRQYKELIDLVRDAGGPVDGIGVQGHMDRFITKAQITRRLNLLAAPMAPTANHPQGLPGLPIEITELDINTQQWNTATPQQQAEVTANVLDAAWEHPSVEGVTIWVMNDSAHWRGNAILFNDSNPTNWQIKPSGQAWIDRVKGTWWTKPSGLSNSSGSYTANVTKGKHRITVEYQGRKQEIIRDVLDPTEVTVQIDATPLDTKNSRLTNLSVRAQMAANQNLIIGFVVSGEMPVLIRAAGPALNQFFPGQTVGMPNPRFTIQQMPGGTEIGGNDNWAEGLAPEFANAGAFGFTVGSNDAATLQPLTGANTAIATGNQSGMVLVEAYDRRAAGSSSKLINLSARNRVGTGDNVLIAGFVVGGTGHKNVLVRAVGPTLGQAPYNVPNVLANPRIELRRTESGGGSTLIAENVDWSADLAGVFQQVGAFALPTGSNDSALVATLEAGRSYTVVVSGVGNTTGEALVEVYELP
jgi:GH35 family endo-1,4-beta-xylanase